MDYEKKYKEALERARIWQNHLYRTNGSYYANELNYIFPELKESENEKTRKQILSFLKEFEYDHYRNLNFSSWIAWLEKQGNKDSQIKLPTFTFDDILALQCCMETVKKVQNDKDLYEKLNDLHGRVYDAYHLEKQGEQNLIMAESPQLGEKKTAKNIVEIWKDMRLEVYQQASGNRHEPNYSDDSTKMFSLNDIDEIIEKMSEQKLDDKIELRFHEGEWIVFNGLTLYIKEVVKGYYRTISFDGINNSYDWDIDNIARLWTIQDAKNGDVLTWDDTSCVVLFKNIKNSKCFISYCFANDISFEIGTSHYIEGCHPATKEQRDTLFAKMKEAGYTFDFEKKELKKVEDTLCLKCKKYD